jgi:hypothetical protein
MRYRSLPCSAVDAGAKQWWKPVLEEVVDRRSFIMTLIGGMAAASLGGVAVAEAAQVKPVPSPAPEPARADDQIAAGTKEALDQTEAEFSQYYYYRRRPRYYRRPVVVYRRPRYYGRPRYYRRRW